MLSQRLLWIDIDVRAIRVVVQFFLCVARGKMAEGINFDRHYGRALLVLALRIQYTESRVLRGRLKYKRSNLDI